MISHHIHPTDREVNKKFFKLFPKKLSLSKRAFELFDEIFFQQQPVSIERSEKIECDSNNINKNELITIKEKLDSEIKDVATPEQINKLMLRTLRIPHSKNEAIFFMKIFCYLGSDFNYQSNNKSLLQIALFELCNLELAAYLKKNGARFESPILQQAFEGNLDILQNPQLSSLQDKIKFNVLDYAIAGCQVELVTQLVTHKPELIIIGREKNNCIHLAVLHEMLDITQILLHYQPELLNSRNKNGKTAIYYAIVKKSVPIVNFLLQQKNIDLDIDQDNGYHAIHIAAHRGFTEGVELLLKINPRLLNEKTKNDLPPLFYALDSKRFETVIRLLEYPNIDLEWKTLELKHNALHIAAIIGNVLIVKRLLQINPRLMEQSNKDGFVPYMEAIWEGNIDVLLEMDANQKQNDFLNPQIFLTSRRENPAHIAARSGNLKSMKFVIDHHHNWLFPQFYSPLPLVNALDNHDMFDLLFPEYNNNSEDIKKILSTYKIGDKFIANKIFAFIKPYSTSLEMLRFSNTQNNIENLKLYIIKLCQEFKLKNNYQAINELYYPQFQETLIETAIFSKAEDSVKHWLELGANADEFDDKEGIPLLNKAIQSGSISVFKLLQENKAKFIDKFNKNNSILHNAAFYCPSEALVFYIWEQDKELIHKKNYYSDTPVYTAMLNKSKNPNILMMLSLIAADFNLKQAYLLLDEQIHRLQYKSSNNILLKPNLALNFSKSILSIISLINKWLMPIILIGFHSKSNNVFSQLPAEIKLKIAAKIFMQLEINPVKQENEDEIIQDINLHFFAQTKLFIPLIESLCEQFEKLVGVNKKYVPPSRRNMDHSNKSPAFFKPTSSQKAANTPVQQQTKDSGKYIPPNRRPH